MTNYLKPVEQRVINGKTFNVFRSPNNMMIQKVGTDETYIEAVDLAYLNNQYIETDIEIGAKPDKVPTVNLLNKMFLKR